MITSRELEEVRRKRSIEAMREALDKLITKTSRLEESARKVPRLGLMVRGLREKYDLSLRELNDLCFGYETHTSVYVLECGTVSGRLFRGIVQLRKFFNIPYEVLIAAIEKEFKSDPPGSRSGRKRWRGRLGLRREDAQEAGRRGGKASGAKRAKRSTRKSARA
jgi:general stress protein YciG